LYNLKILNLEILDSPNSGLIGLRMGMGMNITRMQRKLKWETGRTEKQHGNEPNNSKRMGFFSIVGIDLASNSRI
jgi:hypothetical protein